MTTHLAPEQAQEQFARKITAHLHTAQGDLPYIVTERLRAAREQALVQRKRPGTAPLRAVAPVSSLQTIPQVQVNGTVQLGGSFFQPTQSSPGHPSPVWLRRLLTALPLLALAIGLAIISVQQDIRSTVEVAELDAALLTSELPPDAYTNPGFLHYLQTSAATPTPAPAP